MCALIPDQIESGYLRMGKYVGVFHYLPPGGGDPAITIAPVDFSGEGKVLGTIVAEEPARVSLNIHGLGDQHIGSKDFEITSSGRFGERRQSGRITDGKLAIQHLYPGESVTFSMNHPKFQKVEGRAEDLEAGELREIDIELVADPTR
jgi:hypothetical protein